MMKSRTGLIERRTLLRAAGAGFLASLAPQAAWALERTDAVFGAAYMDQNGKYGVALLSEEGEVLHRYVLPERGHDVLFDPFSDRVIAFARRPGTFAAVVSPSSGDEPMVFHAPEGRHFYGHGEFSHDGKLLYVTENDYDNARGAVGVYDATDDFRRIGEFDSGGVGPHDAILLPDGKTLLIANGGIETHPDYGRSKLNIPTMKPNLALLDLTSGHVTSTHALPPEMHKLSIRHLAISENGTGWFACQDQEEAFELMPLAGSITPDGDLRLLEIPEEHLRMLRGYIGSIAVNDDAGSVLVTSPTGHTALELDQRTGALKNASGIKDVCGAVSDNAGYVLSSGAGIFAGHGTPVMWDNHIGRRG